MSTETRTERGRAVLSANTDADFQKAFGRMLDDRYIDIGAPRELLEKNGIIDSAEEHGLLDETNRTGVQFHMSLPSTNVTCRCIEGGSYCYD